ncbi:MAG: 3-deoxy-7-phosphoheptulonate synthase [Bdellovibrionales bacterium]|nr:3-deoxy-7-phosphoheptulonate synthase [Bdellovibrionales bacterium]
MIIELDPELSIKDYQAIELQINKLGYQPTEVKTQKSHYLIAIGKNEFDIRIIGNLPGVKDVHRVSDAYKLVSRKWKVVPTSIPLGDQTVIGEGELSIIAGPCSLESEEQIEAISNHLLANGVRIMRGGAFKPRTSPYSFRGLGIDGLKLMYKICRAKGIKVISEVLKESQIDEMYDYVDIYQVGARNTQNFTLLHELGRIDKPVFIKRGMSGTIEELLQSAEYVFANGNEQLILCERGIRTFENSTRNTLDINAIPVLKEKSHLPVIVDPSHAIGIRRHVSKLALASILAGADGVIVEIHEKPEEALSDGQQTLNFEESANLFKDAKKVFALRKELTI